MECRQRERLDTAQQVVLEIVATVTLKQCTVLSGCKKRNEREALDATEATHALRLRSATAGGSANGTFYEAS